MFVISVMPISRGAFKDRLSFFSKEPVEPGVIIEVPIRGKKTPALVIESKDAREEKQALRSSEYALKKLDSSIQRRLFPEKTIAAIQEIARHHACPEGIVLSHFSPRAILDSGKIASLQKADASASALHDRLVLSAESEERLRMYRNITREAFARGQSVAILAPTVAESETLLEKLSRGIEEQVALVNSALSKKATVEAWKRAIEDPEPLLIIMTYSFLTIPRQNLSTLIVERESARAFVPLERPHLDARVAAEMIAKAAGARIIFADFPLRSEMRARLARGEADEVARSQVSARGSGETHSALVIDAREKKDPDVPKRKKTFSPLTEKAAGALEEEAKKGGRSFIFASRKGLAPLTICNDCGTPVTDPSSGTAMTLHKTKEGNVFLSFRSGAVVPATVSCRTCGSWNLVSLGIGIERVEEEVAKRLVGVSMFTLTADTAKTHVQARKVVQQFFDTPGSILLGTERALPFLKEPVELAVVASIDSTLASSAWRAHEHALHTLFFLRDRAERLLVQTRQPDLDVMRAVASGNPTNFFERELKEREKFGYPPFATFIGLTWMGTEAAVEKLSHVVTHALDGFDIVGPLPARMVSRGKYLARAVVRLPSDAWPDEKLAAILKGLPPAIAVSIDPDEII